MQITRRKFLLSGAAMAATATLALGTDTILLEPNRPRLNRVEILLSRLPAVLDGFTIAQLSDLHYDEVFSIHPIRKAVEMVNSLQPDLVVLTGDFVTISALVDYLHDEQHSAEAAEPCARVLTNLRARFGVVAALGNHDVKAGADRVIRAFAHNNIPVLRNQSLPVTRDGARLWIAGLDSTSEGRPNPIKALKGIPASEPVIALVHEPDYADEMMRHPVDLQLSGHSHGGQIRFPFLGALYLPDSGRKYPWGRYQLGHLTLYTNIGIGTIRLPIRWNCPPEVSLFTLRSGTSGG